MAASREDSPDFSRLRLLLLDVDGVLTDGRLMILPSGEELKAFSVYDGLAIRMAQRAGMEVAFLSGRASPATRHRAAELGVETVIEGSRDKLRDFEELLRSRQLEAAAVAYVGDDLPDLPVLQRSGLAAAPDNAVAPVKRAAHYVTRARGGHGAVREVVNLILESRGKQDNAT